MPKTKQQKKEIVTQFTTELEKAKSVVFVNYYGLPDSEINDFRKLLKNNKCTYIVAKKTLLKRSLDNVGLNTIDLEAMKGGLGVVFGNHDEMTPAKTVFSFIQKHKQMKIHGGIFKSEFIDEATVAMLATLPSKQELLAQFIRVIKAPVNNLVYVLSGNIRNLVYVLGAIHPVK